MNNLNPNNLMEPHGLKVCGTLIDPAAAKIPHSSTGLKSCGLLRRRDDLTFKDSFVIGILSFGFKRKEKDD